ncbi:MAG: DUF4340 domain-containing protein [Acidobacteriota bacterium]
MRGLRSTIALTAVLAGLGAYIYFVTSKKTDTGTEAPRERVFAALEGDKIDELQVRSESGDTTTVKKVAGAWKMTAPLTTGADEMDTTAIATNLGALSITRVVDEAPTDLKDYGLDKPRIEVAFKASGDKTYANLQRLAIGSKSPTGDLFVKRDTDKRVLLIPGYIESIFNRSTFELRDKTLIKFAREKVDRIVATTDGKPLELFKTGNDWAIAKPEAVGADYGSVDSLIGRLQTAAMKTLVTEDSTPADLKKYGFDKPQATLTVGAGETPVTLVFGGKANETDVYVRDPARSFVATVDGSLIKELEKGAAAYRRRELFAFRGFLGDRLEFTRNGQTIVFEKVKTTDPTPDKWHRVSPTAGDPNTGRMDTLIAKIENLRAATFVDSTAKTGLDKPELTIYGKFDDGKKEERVSFARQGQDVYAAKAGEPGAATVSTAEFDDTLKVLDEVSK